MPCTVLSTLLIPGKLSLPLAGLEFRHNSRGSPSLGSLPGAPITHSQIPRVGVLKQQLCDTNHLPDAEGNITRDCDDSPSDFTILAVVYFYLFDNTVCLLP